METGIDQLLAMLRAAADPTRLRLILLLREAELTVTELTHILGQSQPRVSRHLKLLCEAGLLQRYKEGSWVFYRSADRGERTQFTDALSALAQSDGREFESDTRRLMDVRKARAATAQAFFRANASEWERLRSLHAPEREVEAAVLQAVGDRPVESLLDAGTGTGRMLELVGSMVKRGVGVDVSPEMLAIARDRLERAGLHHCQVRLADAFRLPFPAANEVSGFDIVLFHQVLHYLDDPQAAIIEAARVLKPDGRVLIVDFAPHELEFCRTELAHRRLGFPDAEVQAWSEAAGLVVAGSQSIEPEGAQSQMLTVKLWTATSHKARGAKKVAA
jgi:ubiquinone/menaquinone biosynthesis C-methylase UbiE